MENSVNTDVAQLVRYFEEAEDLSASARRLAERDRDYYDNDQWTKEELETLKKRKQPALVINYIKRKVEFLRGFERRLRSDPKAYPRNPNDESASEAATDALRYVGEANDFDEIRSEVYENLLIEGYGGVDVTVKQKADGTYEIDLTQVQWDRLFYDPHSRESDFSDAKYKGIVIWMDKDDVLQKHPGKEAILDATFASQSLSDTYDDRPKFGIWCDNRRTRVRVVQMHYMQDSQWHICTFTKGGFLVEPQPSPYLDADGQPESSLILRSAYIDRENNRYGHVRDMIGLQDEINKRRSKALHLMNVRQVKYEKGSVTDAEAARRELNKPDGMVEVVPGMQFDILNNGDMASAQFQLLQQATMEMQASGPNSAMSGKDPRQQSGRAIEAQQQGGAIEMEPLVDDLRQWTRDVYTSVWNRVRQFWKEEKWLRVTDDERNIKWVGLNRQVTLGDELAQMPEEQRAQIIQQYQLTPDDPRLNEVIKTENVAAELDVDIIIEEGPDISTLQSEQFEQLSQLAQAGMQIKPELIIEASSLRNKEKILKSMRGEDEEVPPQVQEMQQVMQQMQQELQRLSAENESIKQDKAIKMRELDIKAREADIKQFEAETDRMEAEKVPLEVTVQNEPAFI